jgi:hypothetical protein
MIYSTNTIDVLIKLDFFCDLCKEWIHDMVLIKYLKQK